MDKWAGGVKPAHPVLRLVNLVGIAMTTQSPCYNVRLVATLALSMGVMSFDQASIGYLLPFMKPDLHLTNTQIGVASSTYWVTFAVASYGAGILADKPSSVRTYLIAVLCAFGVCSLFSAFVSSVDTLFLARAVMGVLAGALLTLGQSLLGLASPPEKVGTNMGLVTGMGSSLSALVIAPVVLVQIADAVGWRFGYVAIALPAWLAGVLVFRNILEPEKPNPQPLAVGNKARLLLTGVAELIRYRNILLCVLLCSLTVAYISLGFTFLPIYFVNVRHFSPAEMSSLIVVLGLSSILFAITLPAISDRFGRKVVLLTVCATSVLTPLAACYYDGPVVGLAALLFLGWSMSGTGTFSMGIIPAETVGGEILSRALGFVIALGVLLGGLAGPTIAGWSADRWGAGAPLLVQALCAATASCVAMALHETAPRKLSSGGNKGRAVSASAPRPRPGT